MGGEGDSRFKHREHEEDAKEESDADDSCQQIVARPGQLGLLGWRRLHASGQGICAEQYH